MVKTAELSDIISKHANDVRDYMAGYRAMTDELYLSLFEHYLETGDMPYGVAKARTGDPYAWVEDKFNEDAKEYFGICEG